MSYGLDAEIESNFDYFQRNVGQHLPQREGEYALLHACAIIGFYPTAVQAEAAGEAMFPDEPFSIQEVTCRSVDLGFFSHAFADG